MLIERQLVLDMQYVKVFELITEPFQYGRVLGLFHKTGFVRRNIKEYIFDVSRCAHAVDKLFLITGNATLFIVGSQMQYFDGLNHRTALIIARTVAKELSQETGW